MRGPGNLAYGREGQRRTVHGQGLAESAHPFVIHVEVLAPRERVERHQPLHVQFEGRVVKSGRRTSMPLQFGLVKPFVGRAVMPSKVKC